MSGWIRKRAMLDVLNQVKNCWSKCLVNSMKWLTFSIIVALAQRPIAGPQRLHC